MDFMPITRLVLESDDLTGAHGDRFRSEFERLGLYMRRRTLRWAPRLRPDPDDIEDLSQEVLLKCCRHVRGGGVLGSGLVYTVVSSVLTDFRERCWMRLQEQSTPFDETCTVPSTYLQSSAARVESLKSHLRLAATKVAEEVRERLDMSSAEGQMEFQLLTTVLLLAVEDPASDVKDIYIAAQQHPEHAGWTQKQFQRARRKVKDRPTLGAFLRERSKAASHLFALHESATWGKGGRPAANLAAQSDGVTTPTEIDSDPSPGFGDDPPAASADDDV